MDAKDAVLVDLQAAPLGQLAQHDVVIFGAGEVDQRGAEAPGCDDAEVGLDAGVRHNGRLRRTVSDHAGDQVHPDEGVHDAFGIGRGGEDVYVADAILHAAKAAGGDHLFDGGGGAKVGDDFAGESIRLPQGGPLPEAADLRDALEDFLFGLFADAAVTAERSCLTGRL